MNLDDCEFGVAACGAHAQPLVAARGSASSLYLCYILVQLCVFSVTIMLVCDLVEVIEVKMIILSML